MEESGAKNEKEIDFIPGPGVIRLEKLELLLPPEIQRGKFDTETAAFPKLNSFPQINTAFPKMISRNERNMVQRFSDSDISHALKLSEAELHLSILGSGQKLRYKFFGRLDKLFRGNEKSETVRAIRKRNE